MQGWRGTVEEWLAKLPADGRLRFVTAFSHGQLEVELYAPRDKDAQQPHPRDEIYVVAAGAGDFVMGNERVKFSAGDALFAPSGMAHRFEDFTGHFATWVMFYGPDGGEGPDDAGARDAEPGWHGTAGHWLAQVPQSGIRSVSAFQRGSLEVKLYAPRGEDPQAPHARDEFYVVARGRGVAMIGDERQSFGPADALFVPAGMTHRFEDFTNDLAIWVMFYGPDGGEGAA
ncbi:MAG TPA: cupin domain-containing protein [Alphaproteobacteria bacterium]|nr:cupin domain-containing protein [Alphaproteobacteria bacterium]